MSADRLYPPQGRAFVLRAVTAAFSTILLCLSTSARAVDGVWTDLNPNTASRITDVDLMDVDFVSASTGMVVGAGGTILRTTDGATWGPESSGTTEYLQAVVFLDPQTGVAAGTHGALIVQRRHDVAIIQ